MNPEQLAKSGSEHAEQTALFAWSNQAALRGFRAADEMLSYSQQAPYFSMAETVLALKWLHAIPNAGARGNKIAAAQLKAEGVKAGVADIFLPVPREAYSLNTGLRHQQHGLYIELKRKNGVPSDVSPDQKLFANFVTSQGYEWRVAYGWRQAADIIKAYLIE